MPSFWVQAPPGSCAPSRPAKRGRRVCLHDHAPRIGKKILISGGGRCNFTNLYCAPENFISANPHFAKSALARYTPADFIALVAKHSIAYHEKTLGQLFCDGSAQQILAMLEEECRRAGVRIVTGTEIREISRPGQFVVRTDRDEFHAPALVVATGGLSIPKLGATGFGYDAGASIRSARPALSSRAGSAAICRLRIANAGAILPESRSA